MVKEVSAGAIVFRKENGKIKYLLLYKAASKDYRENWVFPRGNIEENEKEIETVKREIKEETGIEDLGFEKGFREKISWFYRREGKVVFKESIFYLAETKSEKVKLSKEHQDFRWCSFEEANKLLRFKNIRNVFEKANEFLKSSLLNFFS